MKVAVLSPVWFPVPPSGYGGIEWIVSLLADGLADAGHDVTLFASGDSRTRAKLAAVFEQAPSERIGQTFWELQHALDCFARHDDFDVIHDHTGLLGLSLGALLPTPLVHTVHGPVDGHPGDLYERVVRMAPRARLISLSLSQRVPRPQLPWIANVPNALDLSMYPYQPRAGRLPALPRPDERGQGRAPGDRGRAGGGPAAEDRGQVRRARRAGVLRQHVRPHLDSDREYVGEVTHGEKVELLQHARATLFPISWQEPFGLVMIESMACGTPVIATRWGAVPEVIDDGRTRDHRRPLAGHGRLSRRPTRSSRRRCAARSRSGSRPSGWSPTTSPHTRPSPSSTSMRFRSRYDREILRLAVPALGSLAAEPLYVLVDTAIVGHLGRSQLAALGHRCDGAQGALRDLQLPPVRNDGAGGACVRSGSRAGRPAARRARRSGSVSASGSPDPACSSRSHRASSS